MSTFGARFLIDRELWERFKHTVKKMGYMHASDYLREHIRKVVREGERSEEAG